MATTKTTKAEAKDFMKVYEVFRSVPEEAKKTIQAGKLKGFTDINPMWRIKKLTEQFGMCGEGWKIEDVKFWTENAGGEVAAFVSLNLYVKTDKEEWSAPIFGVGGSKLSGKGVGDGINDEAYKMAYTDAISIACKSLGMAADIYFSKDRTKYDIAPVATPEAKPEPVAPLPVNSGYTPCDGETYWKLVKACADGVLCPSGKTAKARWIEMTNADTDAIVSFDQDVVAYKFGSNI